MWEEKYTTLNMIYGMKIEKLLLAAIFLISFLAPRKYLNFLLHLGFTIMCLYQGEILVFLRNFSHFKNSLNKLLNENNFINIIVKFWLKPKNKMRRIWSSGQIWKMARKCCSFWRNLYQEHQIRTKIMKNKNNRVWLNFLVYKRTIFKNLLYFSGIDKKHVRKGMDVWQWR